MNLLYKRKFLLEKLILNFKLLLTFFKLILLVVFIACRCNGTFDDESDSDFQRKIDYYNNNIIKYRTGRLLIKTLPNQKVEIKQLNHEFNFGSAISDEIFKKHNKYYKRQFLKIFRENFNYAVHENALKWTVNEVEQGKYDFKIADEILEFCSEHQIPMRGHCILWSIREKNPAWISELNQDEFTVAVKNRINSVVIRYQKSIREYDVINEMTHDDFFLRQYDSNIRANIYKWTQFADSSLRLYVNDYNILTGEKTQEFVLLIKSLLDEGAPIHGIGCQGHFYKNYFSDSDVYEVLNQLALFNLPIKITEFDIDTKDEKQKAKSFELLFHVFFAHPAVKGIIQWGFWEGAHWKPNAALWKKNFELTPAGLVYRKLVFDKWWTTWNGTVDENGERELRAFYGDYSLRIGDELITFSFTQNEDSIKVNSTKPILVNCNLLKIN